MKHSFVFVCMIALLTGCLKTRADLRAENEDPTPQKVTVAQQRAARSENAAAAPAPAKPAPAAVRFDEIEEQLRQLNGRVDVAENSVAQLAANKQGEGANAAREKQALDVRFQAYEDALKKMEAQVAALTEEVAKLKAPPPAPAPVAAAPAAGGSKRTPYDEGEAYFNNKKWKDAIDAYQKYRDTYPKGKSFADATYKIGASFHELGMKDEARLFFEEVKEKFPGSKEAKKAAVRLKSK